MNCSLLYGFNFSLCWFIGNLEEKNSFESVFAVKPRSVIPACQKAISIDFPGSCFSLFSKTTELNSFIKVSVDRLLLGDDCSYQKSSTFSLRSKAETKIPKIVLVFADLVFQTHNSARLTAWNFAPSRFNWQVSTRAGFFNRKKNSQNCTLKFFNPGVSRELFTLEDFLIERSWAFILASKSW